MFKRLIKAVFLTIVSVILLLSLSLAFLIVTPLGGKLLVRYFKQQFVSVGLVHIGHYEGSLHNGFILKDVRINGLSYLPDALLRIQEIRIHLPLWDLSRSNVDIFNARLFMAGSDPVVFTGRVSEGQIKGNLYARTVDIHEVCRFWVNDDIRKNLQGFISNADLTVRGPWSSPTISGHFLADNIRYQSVILTNGFSRANLTLIPDAGRIRVKGEVIIDSALVKVRKTYLDLHSSKIIYQGDIFNPLVDIHLGSKVEDMAIYLTIKGTSLNPQLSVTSDPPMATQEAMRVLFTDNAWAPSTSPFNGVTSGELAQDFLNYSLQNINDQRQFGFKTRLTNFLRLGIEMDQRTLPTGETNTYYSRKINGEMDMTDHMSLNVSQEVMPQDSYPSTGYQDARQQADTQIYMQYKKRF